VDDEEDCHERFVVRARRLGTKGDFFLLFCWRRQKVRKINDKNSEESILLLTTTAVGLGTE
jgi:hypothetical protein